MSNINKQFQHDKLHRKAITLYRYHSLAAAVGQLSAHGTGLSHHLGNLCKAAGQHRVRGRWGQTPRVKMQDGKKLSVKMLQHAQSIGMEIMPLPFVYIQKLLHLSRRTTNSFSWLQALLPTVFSKGKQISSYWISIN